MKHSLITAVALISLFILSCNKPDSSSTLGTPTPNPSEKSGTATDAVKSSDIYITNEFGQAVPFARVLIGDEPSVKNPWLTTDDAGFLAAPKTWVESQSITIDAADYIRLTLKDQTPGSRHFVLRKKSKLPTLSMRGNVNGIATKDKDGYIDFAIAIDSLSKREVLNFNVNKVVSPWTEEISALGFKFPVPQNIFLPKQKESYFLTVTLQKNWFDMPYDTYGSKSLYTLQGRFPFKKLISELQNNKPYYELVNNFEFFSGGKLIHNFASNSAEPILNAKQILMDTSFKMQSPTVGSNQVIFGLSAYKENNLYQPLDVKYMLSGETAQFKTVKTVTPYFIGVLKNKNEFTMDSASMERASITIDSPASKTSYLPMTKDPIWAAANELYIDLPRVSSADYTDLGMVVVVSELVPLTLPDGKVLQYKLPLWEVHSPIWTSKLVIPNLENASTTAKRVEVTLLAKAADNSGQQNPVTVISNHEERIETATHLTKSASDY